MTRAKFKLTAQVSNCRVDKFRASAKISSNVSIDWFPTKKTTKHADLAKRHFYLHTNR